MPLFREAEAAVRRRHPEFAAQAVVSWNQRAEPERLDLRLRETLRLAGEGLAGVDFHPYPYETEADFTRIYGWAERAATAGLGITCHAGEFGPANVAKALRIPGLTRIGHGVYAFEVQGAVEEIARRGITVEVSLTCNVVLGAVPSFEEHPVRRLVAAGVLVVICTDNPARVCTTIGREYALAHVLGFSTEDLLRFTGNGIEAAFTSTERKHALRALAEAGSQGRR